MAETGFGSSIRLMYVFIFSVPGLCVGPNLAVGSMGYGLGRAGASGCSIWKIGYKSSRLILLGRNVGTSVFTSAPTMC